jgi:CelD/BcsL family acetyltransferase involved in cellulose biosynthesis
LKVLVAEVAIAGDLLAVVPRNSPAVREGDFRHITPLGAGLCAYTTPKAIALQAHTSTKAASQED